MSRVDDRAAEREAAIENATARIAHGKHFPARQLAEEISRLHKILLQEYSTLDNTLDAFQRAEEEVSPIMIVARAFGLRLLSLALIKPKALSFVAEAFTKLKDSETKDPRAAQLIIAYELCESFPPTIGELRRTFVARFGEDRWRGDWPERDRLRFLGLPLSASPRGRRRGSRSILREFGVPQPRSKRKKPKISNRKH